MKVLIDMWALRWLRKRGHFRSVTIGGEGLPLLHRIRYYS